MKPVSRVAWSLALILPLAATWVVVAQDPAPKGGIQIGNKVYRDLAAMVAAGARCATPKPTAAQRDSVQKALRAAKNNVANAGNPVTIPVQFIHLTNGILGSVTEQQRLSQIAVLNDAYAPYGYSFCYDPNGAYKPKTVNNAFWFAMGPSTLAETQCKSTLGVTPDRVLNFYTADGDGLLGWATFPFPNIDLLRDGVVCNFRTLPGGSQNNFNEGDTATHEVGHWLGLFHTFEGGCFGFGDEVADTQAHADPDFGCPSTGPSCNPPASSPVRNFMNYVNDPCMDEFTAGQGARMNTIVALFRPNLGSTGCSGGPGCLLARLAGSAKKMLPFPLSQDDMDGLRKFRDGVLNKSEAGRALSSLYYQQGPKLVELMLNDTQLAGETLMFLAKQMPAVERAVERDGAVHLVQKDYDHGLMLLDRYRRVAPPELARTLTRVEALLQEAVHPGNDVVTLKFPTESNVASAATLLPTPDPISTKTN